MAKDNASISSFKALLGNDGIFDGRSIIDKSIDSRAEAEERAKVEVSKYSNPVITATFRTNFEGLRSGQIIAIQDTTTGRNIDQNFIIQSVTETQDNPECGLNTFFVKCASTVFGVMEFLQKLMRDAADQDVAENEVIFNVETVNEEVSLTESWAVESQNITRETVSTTESWTAQVREPPFYWGATTSTNQAVWNLSVWS